MIDPDRRDKVRNWAKREIARAPDVTNEVSRPVVRRHHAGSRTPYLAIHHRHRLGDPADTGQHIRYETWKDPIPPVVRIGPCRLRHQKPCRVQPKVTQKSRIAGHDVGLLLCTFLRCDGSDCKAPVGFFWISSFPVGSFVQFCHGDIREACGKDVGDDLFCRTPSE